MHRRFRIQVAGRAAILAGLSGAAVYLVVAHDLYLPGALAGIGAGMAAVSLVRYTEKIARDLTRFLESVRYADFTRRFTTDGRDVLVIDGAAYEVQDEGFERI